MLLRNSYYTQINVKGDCTLFLLEIYKYSRIAKVLKSLAAKRFKKTNFLSLYFLTSFSKEAWLTYEESADLTCLRSHYGNVYPIAECNGAVGFWEMRG